MQKTFRRRWPRRIGLETICYDIYIYPNSRSTAFGGRYVICRGTRAGIQVPQYDMVGEVVGVGDDADDADDGGDDDDDDEIAGDDDDDDDEEEDYDDDDDGDDGNDY